MVFMDVETFSCGGVFVNVKAFSSGVVFVTVGALSGERDICECRGI